MVLDTIEFPDRFNISTILRIRRLIKNRLYPWGSSSRVYVPKPGVKDKKRPIIIPSLYREDFIVQAVSKLRGNKGTGTPGVDNQTLDGLGTIELGNIIEQLRYRAYKFRPVKRIMIPKPGKITKRPLGISTVKDRIVQEMIRNILEHIYEPVFSKEQSDLNYGFRPGKSTHQAITRLKQQAQGMEWCIEGDIKCAYDNVNHKILINILSEMIEDKELLDIINQGLKSGNELEYQPHDQYPAPEPYVHVATHTALHTDLIINRSFFCFF